MSDNKTNFLKKELSITNEFVMNLFLNTEAAKASLADFQGDCLAAAFFVGNCFNQAFVVAKTAFADLLNYSSEISNFSGKINTNVQRLSAFVNTLALLGTIGNPFNEAKEGLQALKSLMDDARDKNQLLKFGTGLSVEVTGENGEMKDPLDVFNAIQQKIWNIEDSTGRLSAAVSLKLGQSMTKVLATDKETYQKKYQEGSRSGVISENTLNNVQLMNSALASVKQTWTDVGNMILVNMIDPMKEFSGLIKESVEDISDPDNGALEAIQKIVGAILFLLKVVKKIVAELYKSAKESVSSVTSFVLQGGGNQNGIKMIEEMTNEEYALKHNISVNSARQIRKNRKELMEEGKLPSGYQLPHKPLKVDEWLDIFYNMTPPTMDTFPTHEEIQNKILLDVLSESAKYNAGLKNISSKNDNSRVININNTINCRNEKDALSISAVIRQSVSGLV